MNDYDKRYNVCANMVSIYTDDPASALKHYNMGLVKYESGECRYPPFINEGYSVDRDVFLTTSSGGREYYGTEVTRRNKGPVLPSTLEFMIVRSEVQKMLKEIR